LSGADFIESYIAEQEFSKILEAAGLLEETAGLKVT